MFRRTTRPTDAVEPPEARPVRSLRPAIAAAAVVAAAVVATAVVLPAHEATASSASSLDAHGATRTVRDFLDSSVVDGRTYAACQYLTPGEQVRVAQLQGPATTCADVLASSPATLFGLSSNAGIQHLSLQATVHGSTADVTATQAGRAPVTFVLRPTTADESFSFGAPAAAWRIDAGAGQLFGAPHAAPATAAPRT